MKIRVFVTSCVRRNFTGGSDRWKKAMAKVAQQGTLAQKQVQKKRIGWLRKLEWKQNTVWVSPIKSSLPKSSNRGKQ
ncbi:predicted protein [Arabidopsis lyrata subsp. lyrata]|uniref:Predicted protein n=1 Tax=Arabidopsis lyrata subsp. lyrata TaxID=81972 RepID=D7M168_ARALL|nr:predicted protein [Arabidopsis lyrata subsp. lyrata]